MILHLPVLTGKARFDLWQRYIKSAPPPGRTYAFLWRTPGAKAISGRFSETISGNAKCDLLPDDIVVGAGLQPFLQILCPLIHERKTVSFPTPSFTTCSTIFQDYGLMSITGTKAAM